MTFIRFHRLENGTEIAVLADGGREIRLNEESLQDRITNLKKYNVDTSVEETVLVKLKERNA